MKSLRHRLQRAALGTTPDAIAAARLERLEAELKTARAVAKQTAKEAAIRRERIIGAAFIAALATHPEPEFRAVLGQSLRRIVTKPADRAELASLFLASCPTTPTKEI